MILKRYLRYVFLAIISVAICSCSYLPKLSKKNDADSVKNLVELVSAQIYGVEQDMKGHYVTKVYDREQAQKYGKTVGAGGVATEKVYVKISQEEGLARANAIMKNATFGSGYTFDDKKGGSYVFALTDDAKIAADTPDGLTKGYNLQPSHQQFVDNAKQNKDGGVIYYQWKTPNGNSVHLVGFSKRTPILHWTICTAKISN